MLHIFGKSLFQAGALEVLLSRGGCNLCYHTKVWGIRHQTPLLVIATYVMRTMHLTSAEVTWRQLDKLKLSSTSLPSSEFFNQWAMAQPWATELFPVGHRA